MATPYLPDEGQEHLRGDIEQVRARRVERADLVREILEKKQSEGDDGAQVTPPDGAVPPEAEGAPQQRPPHSAFAAPEPISPLRAPAVAADEAIPHAIRTLSEWDHADQQARAQVRVAQENAKNDRARDRLDPENDFLRALRTEGGPDFLRHIVDDVIRPDDLIASGVALGDLRDAIPATLTRSTRRAFQLGAFAGPGIPFVAVPAVRRAARAFFGAEITYPAHLEQRLAATAESRTIARVLPLTDPILGDTALQRYLERVSELIQNPEVAEIEIEWQNLMPRPSEWDFEGSADAAAMRFAALLEEANHAPNPTTLILRATSSRDLEFTIETVMRALDYQGLERSRVAVAVPVDLPESSTLLRRLAGRAHLRREDGGLPIGVSLYRLADRSPERADALRGGWKVATYVDQTDIDANMFRIIDAVLGAEQRGALELEVSGDVEMDAVFAMHLARLRDTGIAVSVVLAQGERQEIIDRFVALGARVHLRLALLPGDELRPATRYLWARVTRAARDLLADATSADEPSAERNAAPAIDDRILNAFARMHQVHAGQRRSQHRVQPEDAPGLTASISLELFPEGLLEDEAETAEADPKTEPIVDPGADIAAQEDEFRHAHGTSGAAAGDTTVLGSRASDGSASELLPKGETGVVQPEPDEAELNPADTGASPNLTEVVLGLRRGRLLRNTFRNEPASDPTVGSTREWATRVQRRAARSELGIDEAASHELHAPEEIDAVLDQAHAAGESWRQTTGWERAASLEQLAKAIDVNRARLIEVAMNETGMTFAEVDEDVSRAVDLANYDAHLARQLDRMQGARHEPVRVSLAVPGWIPPVSSTAATVFASLAGGSAVVLKPSPQSARTAAVLARILWSTDLPDGVLQVASADHRVLTEDQLGQQLTVDPRVERVLMQGAYETAAKFLSWRHELPLIGASGGRNSVIVTPAADYDQAAAEIARSLVTSSGQDPLRPAAVILVGAAARSERFITQLVDAVTSTRVGYPADPTVHVGPLVTKAVGNRLAMLTELSEQESWLVEPRSLDDTDRLWTPGIRVGVTPESPAMRNDAPVPVINILTARTFDEAIRIQNDHNYGLAAGLFSLDRAEIAQWVQHVEAGNLYVNRDTLGRTVQRQPDGGWRRSQIGTKLKSGGPNVLLHLGRWRADEHEQSKTLHLRGLEDRVARLIESLQPGMSFDEFERVRRTALSCQIAWNEEFGEVVDASNLQIERNLLRYRPAPCVIRFSEDGTADQLGQVLVAATVARSQIDLSSAWPLPTSLTDELAVRGANVRIESDAEFLERIARDGLQAAPRLRLIGGSRSAVCSALRNMVDIAVFSDDVTLAGRIEMMPFLREQMISIAGNRYGRPDERVADLFPHEQIRDPNASLLGHPER